MSPGAGHQQSGGVSARPIGNTAGLPVSGRSGGLADRDAHPSSTLARVLRLPLKSA